MIASSFGLAVSPSGVQAPAQCRFTHWSPPCRRPARRAARARAASRISRATGIRAPPRAAATRSSAAAHAAQSPGPRHRLDRRRPGRGSPPRVWPATASHIRSALAMLISQPRASNAGLGDGVAVAADEHLHPVAAHRVVALAPTRRTRPSRPACAGRAPVPPDFVAVEVADLVEHQAKNSRTRCSASASTSISSARRVDAEARARACCRRPGGASAARRSDCRRAPRCPARSSRVATSCACAPSIVKLNTPPRSCACAEHAQARHLGQPRQRVLDQRRLVRRDRVDSRSPRT